MNRTRRLVLTALPIAVGALIACALLVASSASASDDPCTATGSNLNGGQARNVFCGTAGDDTLKGNRGNDELRGFAGRDDLQGGADDDDLIGGTAGDRLDGGSGFDELFGQSGNDRLIGGTGEFDRVFGGLGDDVHELRDGELDYTSSDALDCGPGQDTLDMDLVDAVSFFTDPVAYFLGCETITVGAVNEGPNVVIPRRSLRVSEDGRTAVRLRCPASLQQPTRCRGRLKLQLATRRSLRRQAPRTRYSIRPGRSRRIGVRLSRGDRRSLRRRRRARGVVTSVENGKHGKRTTVQTVRLRARR